MLIKKDEISTAHDNLEALRGLIRDEMDEKTSLPHNLANFLTTMKNSCLSDNLYCFKKDSVFIKIDDKDIIELLIELYSRIHPGEDNYIENFVSTLKLNLRKKTSEDDEDFGPVSNLKRKNPKILIRTDATKDIARILLENNKDLKEMSPEKYEGYWTFLSLYHMKHERDKLKEINFNNTILVGMSYHSIADYVNCTPLRAYLTHHIFNTELGQKGLILSAFPLMGLLTRFIAKIDKNYFKEPPNLRDFLIPSLGDCFWLTDSNDIMYFHLLTSTPTSGRTMYDGIPSILDCKIEQKEKKKEEFLPKWNLVDINNLDKFWSNVALEYENRNLSIKSKLTIDSENTLNSIEKIRKTSTIEKPLRIAQYYSWLDKLNWDIEKILTNNNPKSASYIQSNYGLTSLEFKEIIVFHCSMGWYINQSISSRPKTNCDDDARANAEIVSVLASLNRYRRTYDGEYITYKQVLKNVKKYIWKERVNKLILLDKSNSYEYLCLIKWISKENSRFETIQQYFNEINKKIDSYHTEIRGFKSSIFNEFINETFLIAGNNIKDIVYKKPKYSFNIYDFVNIFALPLTIHQLVPMILNSVGISIDNRLNSIFSWSLFFVALIIISTKKIYMYVKEKKK